jgi:hypothetical protein
MPSFRANPASTEVSALLVVARVFGCQMPACLVGHHRPFSEHAVSPAVGALVGSIGHATILPAAQAVREIARPQ